MLNPIKFSSIKRNEISKRQNPKGEPIEITENRVQRNSIVLKDVAYIIEASVFVDDNLIEETKSSDNPITVMKYRTMFERRVKKGQCWHQPSLGTREFAADFTLPNENDKPLDVTYPIGSMFYDMYYEDEGKAIPEFFYDVAIVNGVLECPEDKATKMLTSSHIQPKSSDDYNRVIYEHYKEEEAK